MATDKSKNDPADLIFDQPGLAPWDLLHRALGGEARGADPGEGALVAFSLRKIAKKFKLGASLLNKMKISSFQM
jgi:hypothetical protein